MDLKKNALSEGVEILTTNCNMGVSETELCTSKTASVNRENDEKLSNLWSTCFNKTRLDPMNIGKTYRTTNSQTSSNFQVGLRLGIDFVNLHRQV